MEEEKTRKTLRVVDDLHKKWKQRALDEDLKIEELTDKVCRSYLETPLPPKEDQ